MVGATSIRMCLHFGAQGRIQPVKKVTIYTDGAAEPNPGPGGYGVVLIYGTKRRELSGGFRRTTNNRMELLAAIEGLAALKEPCKVVLHSDSRYLVDAMNEGWARRWQKRNWRRKGREPALNADLWERLICLCDDNDVDFRWVKGHAGNPNNERCDELATRAAARGDLPPDESYEREARPAGEEEPRGRKTNSLPTAKMTREGQPCRKCSAPVVKRSPRRKPKPGQTYYYEYYLYCPACKTMYMVESAKRPCDPD